MRSYRWQAQIWQRRNAMSRRQCISTDYVGYTRHFSGIGLEGHRGGLLFWLTADSPISERLPISSSRGTANVKCTVLIPMLFKMLC